MDSEMAWRPIESAPRTSGAPLLLYWPRYSYDGSDSEEYIGIGWSHDAEPDGGPSAASSD